MTKFGMVTQAREKHFQGVSDGAAQGSGPQRRPNFGDILYLYTGAQTI